MLGKISVPWDYFSDKKKIGEYITQIHPYYFANGFFQILHERIIKS